MQYTEAIVMFDVAVVIPNLNGAEVLGPCLESIERAAGSFSTHAVVVDNASRDGSVALVQERFPDVTVLTNSENQGFAVACNRGGKAVDSRYVLLLNSDVVLPEDSLSAMIRYADAHELVGAITPQVCSPSGDVQIPRLGLRSLWAGDSVRMTWLPGTCLLLRRSALEQIDWLDEGFFFYNEDIDLSWRLRKAKWQLVYLPGVRISHIAGHASHFDVQTRAVTLREGYRGSLRLARKHYPWVAGGVHAGLRLAASAQGLTLRLKQRFMGGLSQNDQALMLACQQLRTIEW